MPCHRSDFKLVVNELYGNCFAFNSEKHLFSSKYGPKFGLKLELFLGGQESSSPMSSSNGAILFISNQSSFISQSESGIELAPATKTNIAISRMFISKLPSPYNDCIENKITKDMSSHYSSIVSELAGSYSKLACIELCYQSYLLKEFQCLDRSLKYYDYLSRNDCFNSTIQNKESALKAKKKLFDNEICTKECPLECDSILHRISLLSVSDYPSKFYEKMLLKNKFVQQKFKNKKIDFENSLLAGIFFSLLYLSILVLKFVF